MASVRGQVPGKRSLPRQIQFFSSQMFAVHSHVTRQGTAHIEIKGRDAAHTEIKGEMQITQTLKGEMQLTHKLKGRYKSHRH